MKRKRNKPKQRCLVDFHKRSRGDFIVSEPVRDEELPQASACWRKIFYGTEAKARQAAKSDKVTCKQEPYPCPYCKGWHLSKSKKR